MSMNAGRKTGKSRGYLLIEVMVAGSVIAITLAVSVVFVVEGRKNTSMAAHRQAAMSLARGKCSEIVAALPTATVDQALTAVGSNFPGFSQSWTTVAATMTGSSTPAITVAASEVTCTVEYPAAIGSVDDRASGSTSDGRASLTVKNVWFTPQGAN